MLYYYFPAFKTRDSELRAYNKLNDSVKDKILPIVSLTRSRISKTNVDGNLEKKIDDIEKIFKNRFFILDLATENSVINAKISELFNSYHDGYAKWVDFIKKCKDKLPNLIPCIHFNPDYIGDVNRQIDNLAKFNSYLALRLPAYNEEELIYYINAVEDSCNSKTILILDCIENTKIDFLNLIKRLNLRRFKNTICLNSTFPKSMPKDKQGCIELKEQKYYFDFLSNDVCYGDYACCYPVRYDMKSRGWIPRIDIPVIKEKNQIDLIYYAKEKTDVKNKIDSRSAYEKCAKQLLSIDDIVKLQDNMNANDIWGWQMFQSSFNGQVLGSSPSFWISVRMNIYMSLTVIKFDNCQKTIELDDSINLSRN